MSLLSLQVTGKAEKDLRPVKGATMEARAGLALFLQAMVVDVTMEEAIVIFFPFLLICCDLHHSKAKPSSVFIAFIIGFFVEPRTLVSAYDHEPHSCATSGSNFG